MAQVKATQQSRVAAQPSTQPQPARGVHGLRVADNILKERECVGLLIGGLAFDLLTISKEHINLAGRKDIDVLILDTNCRPPGSWEGGIDWWVNAGPEHIPNNGSWVGLIWNFGLRSWCVSPGLYLAPLDVLCDSIEAERRINEKLRRRKVPTKQEGWTASPAPIPYQRLPHELLVVRAWRTADTVIRPYERHRCRELIRLNTGR